MFHTALRLSASRLLESSQQQQQQQQQQQHQHTGIVSSRASAAPTSVLRYKPALVSDNSEVTRLTARSFARIYTFFVMQETSSSPGSIAGGETHSSGSSTDAGDRDSHEHPNMFKNLRSAQTTTCCTCVPEILISGDRFDLNDLFINDDTASALEAAPTPASTAGDVPHTSHFAHYTTPGAHDDFLACRVSPMSSVQTSLAPGAGAGVANRMEMQLPSVLSSSSNAVTVPPSAPPAPAVPAAAPLVAAAPTAVSTSRTVTLDAVGAAAFDAHLASTLISGDGCFKIACLPIAN